MMCWAPNPLVDRADGLVGGSEFKQQTCGLNLVVPHRPVQWSVPGDAVNVVDI